MIIQSAENIWNRNTKLNENFRGCAKPKSKIQTTAIITTGNSGATNQSDKANTTFVWLQGESHAHVCVCIYVGISKI